MEGARAAMFEEFFPAVRLCGSRAGTTSRFSLHFSLPAISRHFSSRHFAGFRIRKGFRIFWVLIQKVFVSSDPKWFSYLLGSHPKGFCIFGSEKVFVLIFNPPSTSTSTMHDLSMILLS